jgi:hypothetical protein
MRQLLQLLFKTNHAFAIVTAWAHLNTIAGQSPIDQTNQSEVDGA